jgi:arylsulfatase A
VYSRAIKWWGLKGVKEPVVASIDMAYPGAVRTQRWRAVNEGESWQLFDMQADPGQKKDVAAAHPNVAKDLAEAYDDWFVDARKVPIVRPVIDVGHAQWPETKLTVAEAYKSEGLRWYNKWGFAHDWITDWKKAGQKIWWQNRVVTGGRYRVSLRYACAQDMVGSQLKVSAGGVAITGEIKAAHTPNPVQRPTRIKKPRFVQTFVVEELGEIELKAGETKTMIELGKPTGESSIDLHSLIWERMD